MVLESEGSVPHVEVRTHIHFADEYALVAKPRQNHSAWKVDAYAITFEGFVWMASFRVGRG
jgi:hypothetical protein